MRIVSLVCPCAKDTRWLKHWLSHPGLANPATKDRSFLPFHPFQRLDSNFVSAEQAPSVKGKEGVEYNIN
jgi:hypothetical protein